MESKVISIKNCSFNDHLLVASLILTENYIHFTFSECILDYKKYLQRAKKEFHINFLELVKIKDEISNVSQYPTTTDGPGLFETVYQLKNSSLIMNLTYRELWKFDNKPMMSSNDMPGKITLSDETILHINLLSKKQEYIIAVNKMDNSMKISMPASSKITEKDFTELMTCN